MSMTTRVGNFFIVTSMVQTQGSFVTLVMHDTAVWDVVISKDAESAESMHHEMTFAAEMFSGTNADDGLAPNMIVPDTKLLN